MEHLKAADEPFPPTTGRSQQDRHRRASSERIGFTNLMHYAVCIHVCACSCDSGWDCAATRGDRDRAWNSNFSQEPFTVVKFFRAWVLESWLEYIYASPIIMSMKFIRNQKRKRQENTNQKVIQLSSLSAGWSQNKKSLLESQS